jgi:hypothetical protein
MIQTIEKLWEELSSSREGPRQKRVDSTHPYDLYADFEAPHTIGMVIVCEARPVNPRPLRAIATEIGYRSDGRWSLRIALLEPLLRPVFAALCADIVSITRTDVHQSGLPAAVLGRIDTWRNLLERGQAGLDEMALRGMIGELLVLETQVLATLSPEEAVDAWKGPLGAPQDFLLPTGSRIEVKAIGRSAKTVQIHGLDQLDPSLDRLTLAVVRLAVTGPTAPGATTASLIVARLRKRLLLHPSALAAFDRRLANLGWHEHESHDKFAVHPIAIEYRDVQSDFPRLVSSSVPSGILGADYTILLPDACSIVWRSGSD